jgi:hypothetical protein
MKKLILILSCIALIGCTRIKQNVSYKSFPIKVDRLGSVDYLEGIGWHSTYFPNWIDVDTFVVTTSIESRKYQYLSSEIFTDSVKCDEYNKAKNWLDAQIKKEQQIREYNKIRCK